MYPKSQQRASSPIKDHIKTFTINDDELSFNDPFLETGDSTRSLLAPLYSDCSYRSAQFKDLPDRRPKYAQAGGNKDDTMDESLRSQSVSSICSSSVPDKTTSAQRTGSRNKSVTSRFEDVNSSSLQSSQSNLNEESEVKEGYGNRDKITWEDWLLKKTIEDIENLNLKREKRKQAAMEKRRLKEEKMAVLKKSVEQREEWVIKKDAEMLRKIKEKQAEIQSKLLKEEEEKRLIEEKALSKFQEWQHSKVEEEKEKKKKSKEEKRKSTEQSKQKKLLSEQSYNVWLEKSKTKKIKRTTYGYTNGELFSYYDMGCSPAPSYKNPLPWVDAVPTGEKCSSKEEFFSPPMLWKDVEKRDSPKVKRTKAKRTVVKHSCIGR